MPVIVVLILGLSGMDCVHCVGRIERVLQREVGVHQVNTELAGGWVRITFDAAVTAAVELVNRVEQAGFTVTHIESIAP